MNRSPAWSTPNRYSRPKTPKSKALSGKRRASQKPKQEWNDNFTDIDRFKLTKEEVLKKKALLVSKHNMFQNEIPEIVSASASKPRQLHDGSSWVTPSSGKMSTRQIRNEDDDDASDSMNDLTAVDLLMDNTEEDDDDVAALKTPVSFMTPRVAVTTLTRPASARHSSASKDNKPKSRQQQNEKAPRVGVSVTPKSRSTPSKANTRTQVGTDYSSDEDDDYRYNTHSEWMRDKDSNGTQDSKTPVLQPRGVDTSTASYGSSVVSATGGKSGHQQRHRTSRPVTMPGDSKADREREREKEKERADILEMTVQIQSLLGEMRYYEQLSGRKSFFNAEEVELALDNMRDSCALDASGVQPPAALSLHSVMRFLVQLVCQSMTYLLQSEIELTSQRASYKELSSKVDAILTMSYPHLATSADRPLLSHAMGNVSAQSTATPPNVGKLLHHQGSASSGNPSSSSSLSPTHSLCMGSSSSSSSSSKSPDGVDDYLTTPLNYSLLSTSSPYGHSFTPPPPPPSIQPLDTSNSGGVMSTPPRSSSKKLPRPEQHVPRPHGTDTDQRTWDATALGSSSYSETNGDVPRRSHSPTSSHSSFHPHMHSPAASASLSRVGRSSGSTLLAQDFGESSAGSYLTGKSAQPLTAFSSRYSTMDTSPPQQPDSSFSTSSTPLNGININFNGSSATDWLFSHTAAMLTGVVGAESAASSSSSSQSHVQIPSTPSAPSPRLRLFSDASQFVMPASSHGAAPNSIRADSHAPGTPNSTSSTFRTINHPASSPSSYNYDASSGNIAIPQSETPVVMRTVMQKSSQSQANMSAGLDDRLASSASLDIRGIATPARSKSGGNEEPDTVNRQRVGSTNGYGQGQGTGQGQDRSSLRSVPSDATSRLDSSPRVVWKAESSVH